MIAERDARPVIELEENGLLADNEDDLLLDAQASPAGVATLWGFVTPRLVITAHSHPLRSSDALRQRLRDGLRVRSGIELIAHLFDLRIKTLREEADRLSEEVHDIEDRMLTGRAAQQRRG